MMSIEDVLEELECKKVSLTSVREILTSSIRNIAIHECEKIDNDSQDRTVYLRYKDDVLKSYKLLVDSLESIASNELTEKQLLDIEDQIMKVYQISWIDKYITKVDKGISQEDQVYLYKLNWRLEVDCIYVQELITNRKNTFGIIKNNNKPQKAFDIDEDMNDFDKD